MVLSVLLALLVGVGPQTLQTPDPNRVEDVRISGNRRIPSDTIKYNLQTKTNDRLNPAVIARDVKTLMAQGYFDDVRVDAEPGKTGQIVTFVVKEKPTIRSVKYDGLKSVTNSEVLDKLKEKKVSISQESVYDPTKIKKAETIIKSPSASMSLASAKKFRSATCSRSAGEARCRAGKAPAQPSPSKGARSISRRNPRGPIRREPTSGQTYPVQVEITKRSTSRGARPADARHSWMAQEPISSAPRR